MIPALHEDNTGLYVFFQKKKFIV